MFTILLTLISIGTFAGPIQTDDAPFTRGTLDAHGMKLVEEMRGKINDGSYLKVHAVLAIQDGKILIEEYGKGQNATTTTDIRSAGKSISSLLIGIAIDRGEIKSVKTPLYSILHQYRNKQGWDPDKDKNTLEHVLTMTTGLDCDDNNMESPGNEENMYPKDNWMQFFLDIPVARNPGEPWHYCTAATFALSEVLRTTTGMSPIHYAAKHLFQPLGITRDITWPISPQGRPMTGGGIELTATEMAIIGQMMLNGGQWRGKRIISESWVNASLKPLIAGYGDYRYGYLWWHQNYPANGRMHSAAFATGNGGNKIFIFPEENIVVVFASSAYNNSRMHREKEEMLVNYVLPALLSGDTTKNEQ